MGGDLFVDYLVAVSPEINQQLHQYLVGVPEGSPLDRYLYSILNELITRGGKRARPAMARLDAGVPVVVYIRTAGRECAAG